MCIFDQFKNSLNFHLLIKNKTVYNMFFIDLKVNKYWLRFPYLKVNNHRIQEENLRKDSDCFTEEEEKLMTITCLWRKKTSFSISGSRLSCTILCLNGLKCKEMFLDIVIDRLVSNNLKGTYGLSTWTLGFSTDYFYLEKGLPSGVFLKLTERM